MNYRACNACGLSNLATVAVCFRCGAALGPDPQDREPATLFAEPPTAPRMGGAPDLTNCPSCGSRVTPGARKCGYCEGDLPGALSADFYQARLVPDSGFRRAQFAAAVDPFPPDVGIRSMSVTVFAVINLVLGIVSLGWGAVWFAGVISAATSSLPKDQGAVPGLVMFLIGSLIYGVVFSIAGLGLFKRKTWGYYAHLVGAILGIFSCFGILYSIPALIFAFQPNFKRDFPAKDVG